ncbi:MAG TPA: glycosyltransferase [Anaerolineales bacterium]|nr:glycosyltransferase [Anaerolineales bacterium]
MSKNWACHQLAQAAHGDILLFVDADTVLHPDAAGLTVAWMHATQADVLSGLPYQVMETPAERLSLPFIRLGMRAILPHWLNRWLRLPALAVAVGQFLAFRRSVYRHMGGYKAVRGEVIEDVALARLAVRQGWQVLHADLRRRVATRMYTSWAEIRQGFLKNLQPFFGRQVPSSFWSGCCCGASSFCPGWA